MTIPTPSVEFVSIIPIALDEAAESGRLQPGMHVLSVAFGAGLTWSAMVYRW